ncbi:MAG: hypothetical protein OSB44_08765 [Verrucomicrobiales bacterium]|nr:hypothetical protein [Verrucomicrobiales bacterium]
MKFLLSYNCMMLERLKIWWAKKFKISYSVGFLLIGLSLALQPASAQFMTGFEPAEGYVGAQGSAGNPPGSSQLVPQQGWQAQFGNSFDVHTYIDSEIPWTPQTGPELYTAPENPSGGEQFIALGTSDSSGGGSDVHSATFSGLVELSADYAPAYEFDNGIGNYNGALLARMGTTNVTGLYTCAASTATDRSGPWAFELWAFAQNGIKVVNWAIGYRLDGVEGFDDLEMEKWYRIGIVFDLDPASPTYRRIMQLKSQDLSKGGKIWIIDEPKGTSDEDLYIDGGSTGTTSPDLVRIYNVGNGTLSMFDNIYVGKPYDWQSTTDAPFAITSVTRGSEPNQTTITWSSLPSRSYSLEFSTDLINWIEVNDSVVSPYTDDSLPPNPLLETIFYRVRDITP